MNRIKLGLILIVIFLASATLVAAFTINGNTVTYEGAKGKITQTPHTLTDFVNYPVINFTSYFATTQELDIALGFNVPQAVPKRAKYYNPHYEYEEKSYTCQHHFNYTTNPKYFWCWENVTSNSTWEYKLLFAHEFESGNLGAKTAYWTESEYVEWTDISSKFNQISYNFDGKNTWYVIEDVSFDPDETKTLKLKVVVEPNTDGKYDILIKRHADSWSEAISSGNYVLLDPWWNASFSYCKDIVIVENSGGDYPEGMPVEVIANTSGNGQAGGQDIRILDEACNDGGNVIDFGIRQGGGADNFTLAFKVPITGSATETYSMYYGCGGCAYGNISYEKAYYNYFDGGEDQTDGVDNANLMDRYSSTATWYANNNASLAYNGSYSTFATASVGGFGINYNSTSAEATATLGNMSVVEIGVYLNTSGNAFTALTSGNGTGSRCGIITIDQPTGNVFKYYDDTTPTTTGITPSLSTWYILQIQTNTSTNLYNASIYTGADMALQWSATDIGCFEDTGKYIDESRFEWGTTWDAVLDNYKMYYWIPNGFTPTLSLGAEQSNTGSEPPLWSSNTSNTPTNYSPSTYSTFNMTWANGSETAIVNTSTVNITINGTDYLMSLISGDEFSGIYGYQNILGAGFYSWNSSASNNASPIQSNTSDTWNFSISKVVSSCSLSITPATPTMYNNTSTAVCGCTNPEGSMGLYRNGTDVTAENNTPIVLGVGIYGYECNVTETSNYTTAANNTTYTVNQGYPPMSLDFNTSDTVVQGTPVLITCSHPAELTPTLYNDTSNISNPTTFNTTGIYGIFNYTCNTTGNANYSARTLNKTLTVTLLGGLSINEVLDEKTLTPLTFNVTIYNSSFSTTENNIMSYNNNTVKGDLTVSISSSGYIPRNYYVYVPLNGSYNFTGYLLATGDGVYVTYWSYSNENPTGEAISYHRFRRFIGSEYVVVTESTADLEGKGTVFLDPYTNYVIDSETSDGLLTNNISSYNPNPSFILRIDFSGTTGSNITWEFDNTTYSLYPENVYLRYNNVSNITQFNYTISSNNDVEWYALRLLYNNGTELYLSNITNQSSGGYILVNLNYTLLSLPVHAETYLKKTGYSELAWNRTYIILSSETGSIGEALDYAASSSGLPIVVLSLVAVFVSFGISMIANRVVRTGAGIIYLAVLTIFGIYGMFGSDPTVTWRILIGLYFIEAGIIMYKEIW